MMTGRLTKKYMLYLNKTVSDSRARFIHGSLKSPPCDQAGYEPRAPNQADITPSAAVDVKHLTALLRAEKKQKPCLLKPPLNQPLKK